MAETQTSTDPSHCVTRPAIEATYALIRPHIRHTPVLAVEAMDFDLAGEPLTFKLETLQHTGSFKVRGAFASLLALKSPSYGVVAASGGNHGVAVAFAAMRLGLSATIFVPSIVSAAKAQRIRSYGATLVIAGERYDDALAASIEFVAKTGAEPIHAFDQIPTLLGQGTVGLEFERDAAFLDTLLVATGGGGLIGGIAGWYAGNLNLVAVEPEAAPTLHDALAAGRPVDAAAGGIAADSLAPKRVGDLMFPLARAHVARSVLVTDEEIRKAQAELWSVLRTVVEPGGAAAFAALQSGKYRASRGERVGILLCGSNTTAVDFK